MTSHPLGVYASTSVLPTNRVYRNNGYQNKSWKHEMSTFFENAQMKFLTRSITFHDLVFSEKLEKLTFQRLFEEFKSWFLRKSDNFCNFREGFFL